MSTALPVTRDITIYQGSTWRWHLRWGTRDTTTGVVTYQPLATWTARMQIRRRHGHDVMLDLSTENGGITLDDNGNIVLYASDDQTRVIPRAPRYYYDIELYQPNDGDVFRFFMGEVTLSEEITDETAVVGP